MEFLVSLAEKNLLAFAAIFLASQLLAHEAGYRLGVGAKSKASGQAENISVVVAGMLGLLAFVLALTLSYSNDQFNQRRQGALTEANAIGSAWLIASAIESPHAGRIGQLLEHYASVREQFVSLAPTRDAIDKANEDTTTLQNSIWESVTLLVRERPNEITASLMQAITDTFDASTAERFAFAVHLPWQIFWLLIGLALLSMALLGYQFGLRGAAVRVVMAMLTAVWTILIVNILDLATARIGNFHTNVAVYQWTIDSFHSGASQ